MAELGSEGVHFLGPMAAHPTRRARPGQREGTGLLPAARGRPSASAASRPALTLYHWELPQALQERGGWLERDTVERFVDTRASCTARSARRCRIWITQNEPHTSAWLGHGSGRHAPGLTGDLNALTAAHHLLLSHGRVVQALRPADERKSAHALRRGDRRHARAPGRPATTRPTRPPPSASMANRTACSWTRFFSANTRPTCGRATARSTRDFAFVRPGDLDGDPCAVRFPGRQLLQPHRHRRRAR